MTGIVCTNDLYALAVWRLAEERGLRVPRDLSLTGVDNIIEARQRGQAHHLPAAGGGEPLGVFRAEVVTVRFHVRRKRAENGGGVGVDVRECEDGRLPAGGTGTAADGAHGGTVSVPRSLCHHRAALN